MKLLTFLKLDRFTSMASTVSISVSFSLSSVALQEIRLEQGALHISSLPLPRSEVQL